MEESSCKVKRKFQKQAALLFDTEQPNQSSEDKKFSQQLEYKIISSLNNVNSDPYQPTRSKAENKKYKQEIYNKIPTKRKNGGGTVKNSNPSPITSHFCSRKKFLKNETKDDGLKSTYHSCIPEIKKEEDNKKYVKKFNDSRPSTTSSQESQETIKGEPDKDEEPLSVLGDLLGTMIPNHKNVHEKIPLPAVWGSRHLVALGVETTSLDQDCHIIQITCSNLNAERPDFSCYILPGKEIHFLATKVNGLTFKNGLLKQNGKVIQKARSLTQGLEEFISYLQENTILISHNSKHFQALRLVRGILKTNLMEPFSKKVIGFSDSYSLFLELYPRWKKELKSYKLQDLIKHFSGDFTKGNFMNPVIGQDNLIKIKNLVFLLHFHNLHAVLNLHKLYDHSMTLEFFIYLHSFDNPVKNNFLSRNIAKKMASSGLTLEHLEIAHSEAGPRGVFELLVPRITSRGSALNRLWRHFSHTGDS